MQNLYDPSTAEEVKRRIDSLTPESTRQWGKMTAPQMLAHCSTAMETAVGDTVIPRMLIGRLLGWAVKPTFSNEKPLSKNGPTAPALIITDIRDLATERDRLNTLIDRFSTAGPDGCTKAPHCFFGHLTPQQWAIGMYKHLDHHLRQFNA